MVSETGLLRDLTSYGMYMNFKLFDIAYFFSPAKKIGMSFKLEKLILTQLFKADLTKNPEEKKKKKKVLKKKKKKRPSCARFLRTFEPIDALLDPFLSKLVIFPPFAGQQP